MKSQRAVWHLLNQSCSSSSQQKVVIKDESYFIFPWAQEITNKFEHYIMQFSDIVCMPLHVEWIEVFRVFNVNHVRFFTSI